MLCKLATDTVHLKIQLVKLFLVRLAKYVKLSCLSCLLSPTFINVTFHVVLVELTDSPASTQAYNLRSVAKLQILRNIANKFITEDQFIS